MSEENKYTFENEEYRKTYWHTCSHVLAQAVKRLWPEVKLAIGPSIDNGFYYDMLAPFSFTPENLAEIEAEMRKICKEKLKLERFELPRAEAIKFMEEKEEPFKVELINALPEDAVISFYKQGEFTDLCAGPHLDSTGRIKGNAIKLTACNAAYWRGDSNREVLQRIYGVAFPKKEELDAYLKEREEAVKRDHNNRRVFDEKDVKWIKDLTCLKKCGMSIQEMKDYLALCLQGERTIPQRKILLAQKQEALRAGIRELQDSVAYIDWKQNFYDEVLSGKRPYESNLIRVEK